MGDVRAMRADDLEPVVAIDQQIFGVSRRDYFERRLRAALRRPGAHIQFCVDRDDRLAAFVLARLSTGAYGLPEVSAVLESIGVAVAYQHEGLGHQLMDAVEAEAKTRGAVEFRTQSAWNDHDMLRFLDARGFELAPRQVLTCNVADALRI